MGRTDVQLTVDDYRELPEAGPRYQLIEGDLVLTPAPATRHQRISRALQMLLMQHVADTGAGEVFNAPYDVQLSQTNVIQPDLLLVLRDHRDRIGPDGLHGAPDLAVEIISPTNRSLDRTTKRKLYARHGTPELWLLDDEPDSVEIYRLDADAERPLYRIARGERWHSPLLPAFRPEVSEVFPAP
jgi:Uma2 family endonuclease